MKLGRIAFIVAALLSSSPVLAAPKNKASKSAASSTAAGPLGDLSSYKKIAVDTQQLVDKGDLKAAKDRIRDLESAWDEAEEKMRPMDEDAWTKADKAIDRALAKLRAPKPNREDCQAKMQALVSTLDALQAAK